jgi:hypothetical protein
MRGEEGEEATVGGLMVAQFVLSWIGTGRK